METEATGDALRLERQLANLRWLVAAFGAVQVGFAIRDRGDDPRFALPLAVALVLGLTTPVWAVAANALWTHTVTILGIAGMAWAASRAKLSTILLIRPLATVAKPFP